MPSHDTLTRRPISNKLDSLNERSAGVHHINPNKPPLEPERLYPSLSEDEEDMEHANHKKKLYSQLIKADGDIELQYDDDTGLLQMEKNESISKLGVNEPKYLPESAKLKQNKSPFSVKKPKNVKKSIKPEQKKSPFNYIHWIIVCIIGVVGLLGSGLFLFFKESQTSADQTNVAQIIEDMQNQFKNQHFLTYRILKSALKKVVDEKNPSAPAIITLIVNKISITTSLEFSQYLAKSLVPQKYIVSINESVPWHNKPNELKLKIDQQIRSNAQNNSLNVVIVDNLHNIPYEAAMVFHGYCDHEHAPLKRTVFLFSVPLNEILHENVQGKKIDEIAMTRLKDIWRRSTNDMIDSLITRITVNVINIR